MILSGRLEYSHYSTARYTGANFTGIKNFCIEVNDESDICWLEDELKPFIRVKWARLPARRDVIVTPQTVVPSALQPRQVVVPQTVEPSAPRQPILTAPTQTRSYGRSSNFTTSLNTQRAAARQTVVPSAPRQPILTALTQTRSYGRSSNSSTSLYRQRAAARQTVVPSAQIHPEPTQTITHDVCPICQFDLSDREWREVCCNHHGMHEDCYQDYRKPRLSDPTTYIDEEGVAHEFSSTGRPINNSRCPLCREPLR